LYTSASRNRSHSDELRLRRLPRVSNCFTRSPISSGPHSRDLPPRARVSKPCCFSAVATIPRAFLTLAYHRRRQLLILADTGGSNSCRTGAWKTELQSQLCNSFGLTVTVAHYPTGASKWNPIEHRLFSEISKNWAAEPLDSYPKVLNFIRHTCTRTGLAVSAFLDRRHYPTGTSPDPEQVRRLSLKRHSTLPAWNYTIAPM
jgi:hypothetical protein